jgi:hypothetical protein
MAKHSKSLQKAKPKTARATPTKTAKPVPVSQGHARAVVIAAALDLRGTGAPAGRRCSLNTRKGHIGCAAANPPK